MKPFNLEQALAGAPVVTRDGRKVLKVVDMESPRYRVAAYIDGDEMPAIFTSHGILNAGTQTESDLFMDEPEMYIFLSNKEIETKFHYGSIWSSIDSKNNCEDAQYYKLVKVEPDEK